MLWLRTWLLELGFTNRRVSASGIGRGERGFRDAHGVGLDGDGDHTTVFGNSPVWKLAGLVHEDEGRYWREEYGVLHLPQLLYCLGLDGYGPLPTITSEL